MSDQTERRPKSVVYGCAGPELLPEEAEFFADTQPFGFILFARNCLEPDQVRRLTAALRSSVGRTDVPILIDQEGGRVERLKPPHWRHAPAAAVFGAVAEKDVDRALTACRLNARNIAEQLAPIGIDVNCLPCLDLFHAPGSPAIGDRAFSTDPELVARLGQAQVDGLMAGNVLPIMKHMPGHGRAKVDSHLELPIIEAPLDALRRSDFIPFRTLSNLPLAMTGHVVVKAIDPDNPATQSAIVIRDIIRQEFGFSGILFSDDIGMQALSGGFADRARKALAAGCDIVLHCSGVMEEMRDVAGVCDIVPERVWKQWLKARAGTAVATPDQSQPDTGKLLSELAGMGFGELAMALDR